MLQPEQILHHRYQLKQQLGQLAGRQTWLAQDLAVQPAKPVVLKLLICGESMQWHDLKLFEREAQVLRQLDHPQIPKYRDSFSIDDRLLWFGLVQEYIPGASLKQLLAQGKHFHQKQVRQIATNLLHLLIYLHELSPPVLHRDIKPSNLIWGKDDYIYLVDFGAVQDKAAAEGATFTVVGTYGYAPMEQFGGRAVAASDLYALGATLIHLLTGVSPADLPHQDLRIQFADRISLDSSFVWWIEQMTEPDVTKRFQTTRQALEALRSAQKPNTVQTPPSGFARSPTTTNARQPEPAHQRSLTLTRGRLRPPSFKTRIQLHQTDDNLLIKVPSISINPWELVLLVPIVFGVLFISPMFVPFIALMSFPWESILFMGVIFLVFTLSIYWILLPTFVQFNAGEFSIYKKYFGTNIKIANGSTADIHDVFHTLKTFWQGKQVYTQRVVIIQTNYREYYFGNRLSWEECTWLVDVIQYWLNLR